MALFILPPECCVARGLLPVPAAILRCFDAAENGADEKPRPGGIADYRIRLNQRSDSDAESSASTAAAAANNAVISVSFCSKKSFVLRFL